MRRHFKLISLFCAAALVLGSLIGCEFLGDFGSADLGYSYVTLSINPSVDLVVNGKGVVELAISGNDDAEMLLVDEDLSGLTVEEAAERFAALAAEAGFIDVDSVSNEVRIEVVGEREASAQNIAERIRGRINGFFENNGIFGSARVETFEKYLDIAGQLSIPISNITLGQLKAIIALLEQYPEFDLEEFENMTIGELIRFIRERAGEVIPPSLREAFRQALEELKQTEFAELMSLRSEIAQLKEQIDAMEDGEEKEALKAELEKKLEQYNTLKRQYLEKVKKLREQFKQQWQQTKNELKERKNAAIEENRQKLEEHRNRVNEKIDEVKEEIRKKQNDDSFNPFTDNIRRAAFEQAYKALKEKYAEIFKLKEEIAELKKKLNNQMTSNTAMEIFESLKEMEERYRQLYEQYSKELDELIKSIKGGQPNDNRNDTAA